MLVWLIPSLAGAAVGWISSDVVDVADGNDNKLFWVIAGAGAAYYILKKVK
jgi:hypothetical protein